MNLADLYIAKKLAGGGGGGTGTDNYNDLSNKPQINGTTLTGDKSAADLELQPTIDSENPISADYVDDSASTNKFVTSSDKLTWGGKQDKIDADHKLSSDLVDDTGHTNLFVTPTEKSTWSGKQNAIDSSHKLSSDLVDDTNHTNKFVTSAEKNTWNAKQNAIDSDHKLSSSLVSFSTVEAAALASGIDSDDVNQIGVNQTNILLVQDATEELVDDGAKNIIPFPYTNPSPYINAGATFTYDDNGIITVNRSTGTSAAYYKIANIAIDSSYIGKEFYVSLSDLTNMSVHLYIKDANNAVVRDLSFAQSGTFTPLQGEVVITVALWTTASATFNNVKVQLMICKKALYDISQNYAPYALPNTDLTRSVSELTESMYIQNIIPCPYFRASGYSANNVVFTYGEDGIINVNGTASDNTYLTIVNADAPINTGLLRNNSYVFSARSSNPNSAIKFRAFYINPSTMSETVIAYDVVNNDIKFLYNPPENTVLALQVYLIQNASANNEKVTVMLEKGYESHDYQPYNLSTFSFRTDMNKLLCAPTLVTTGSLDNFKDTSFCAVDSNVSGKPTGVTGNCFVRTSKMSDTYIMQECFSASGAYYRIYDTNTWSAWMQLSNV